MSIKDANCIQAPTLRVGNSDQAYLLRSVEDDFLLSPFSSPNNAILKYNGGSSSVQILSNNLVGIQAPNVCINSSTFRFFATSGGSNANIQISNSVFSLNNLTNFIYGSPYTAAQYCRTSITIPTISIVHCLIGRAGGTLRLADKTIIHNDAEADGANLVLNPSVGMYLESKTPATDPSVNTGIFWSTVSAPAGEWSSAFDLRFRNQQGMITACGNIVHILGSCRVGIYRSDTFITVNDGFIGLAAHGNNNIRVSATTMSFTTGTSRVVYDHERFRLLGFVDFTYEKASYDTIQLSRTSNTIPTISIVHCLIGGAGGTLRLADKTIIHNDAEPDGANLVLNPSAGMYLESKNPVPTPNLNSGFFWYNSSLVASSDALTCYVSSSLCANFNSIHVRSRDEFKIDLISSSNNNPYYMSFACSGNFTLMAPDSIYLTAYERASIAATDGISLCTNNNVSIIYGNRDAIDTSITSSTVPTISVVHCLVAQGGASEEQIQKVVNDTIYDEVPVSTRTITGTGNASCHWFQLDARRVPTGLLQSISIPCRTNASSGVATTFYYLSIWEQDTNNSTDYVFIGASTSAHMQTINAATVWDFDNLKLSGRSIRINITTIPDTWQTNNWFGVIMAQGIDGEASFGEGNGRVYQVVDLTFNVLNVVSKFAPESHVHDTIMHTNEATHNWLANAACGMQALTAPSLLIKGTSGNNLLSLRGNVTNVTATGPAMTFTVPRFWVNGDYPVLYSTNPSTGVTKTWFGATQDAASLAPLGLSSPGVYAGDASLPLYLRGSELYWNGSPFGASGGGGGIPVKRLTWTIGGKSATGYLVEFSVLKNHLLVTGTGSNDTTTVTIEVTGEDGNNVGLLQLNFSAGSSVVTNVPDIGSKFGPSSLTFTGNIHQFLNLQIYIKAIYIDATSVQTESRQVCCYEGVAHIRMDPLHDGETVTNVYQ